MASRFRKAVVPLGLGLILAASLSACGSDDSGSSASGSGKSDTAQSSGDGKASLESASKVLSAKGLKCMGPTVFDGDSVVELECTEGPDGLDVRLNLKKDVPNAIEAARKWEEKIQYEKVDDEKLLEQLTYDNGRSGILENNDFVGSCSALKSDAQCVTIAKENGWTYTSDRDLAKQMNKYNGWKDTDQASAALDHLDITCGEKTDDVSKGSAVECDDALLAFGNSLSDLKNEAKKGGADLNGFTSVSDGDWIMLCAPDNKEVCTKVADYTGKKVAEVK
ncbi:hypothetical protein GII30_00780 [Gordonia amarae]|uniref:Lipoprotein n=2 Tax=Gordonia amarae TaxID=36821 RepID=G7GV54_9ACTN|nr:hypothetical protein [Gordonia amarae]MCS3876876.1 hypothetical protein [Gordonia amarae]QHN15710.1 hypothetical protein GII35_00780 [Gordonia amarae]QHN20279.1 hypothetical protein GII34_00780 [Gordonia amarae]QHN29130.1 hypothetical protein GII32_00780 [Gordonia amarae]QHN37910.1 hypothetical protein GII30_00780 [Gordonia amarae]